MAPVLTREPPEAVGQVKPLGALVSLAQLWMPPRVWKPIMPAPTPERVEARNTLPFTVPSRSTMMELEAVELVLAFCRMPPPPSKMLLVTLVPWVRRKAADPSPCRISEDCEAVPTAPVTVTALRVVRLMGP